ncbi:hypothetical protein PWJ72_21345 [Serratia nevei]|nr:hypothetical protein [Serratia nevei]
MTQTLTTERMAEIAKLAIRLQQISSCAAVTSSGETVLHHTHVDEILSALHDVTAELLANREAQPVAEVLSSRSGNDTSTIDKALPAGTKVYTAPPAPAVPDEKAITPFFDTLALDTAKMVMCDVNRRSDFLGGDIQLLARIQCRVDDACRAAMLAQPVSQGYTLPPHVYRELVNSLRDTAEKYQGTQQLREQLSRTLTENGLVAAAPEGGNGA